MLQYTHRRGGAERGSSLSFPRTFEYWRLLCGVGGSHHKSGQDVPEPTVSQPFADKNNGLFPGENRKTLLKSQSFVDRRLCRCHL
jgi:hypothetical protein